MSRDDVDTTVRKLVAFNEIAKALTSTLEINEVLTVIMQEVSKLLRPRNWSVLLLDELTGKLHFQIAVGESAETLKALRLDPTEGIAGTVFTTGQPKLVVDVSVDPAFASRFDRVSDFNTQSILAVPLQVRGASIGVIELVKGPTDAAFTQEDLETASGIADFVAIAIDNARNFSRVQELTLTDEHTGLFNARHLRGLLENEVALAQRFHHPLSMIFLDLDRFKQVNDSHGHLAGSGLLREIGEVLRSCIRKVDSAFRYGGDEFAALLLETNQETALLVAERIRGALHGHAFLQAAGLSVRLSASFGVASLSPTVDTPLGLLAAADRAMYEAKAAGRNCVVVAR